MQLSGSTYSSAVVHLLGSSDVSLSLPDYYQINKLHELNDRKAAIVVPALLLSFRMRTTQWPSHVLFSPITYISASYDRVGETFPHTHTHTHSLTHHMHMT